MANAVFATGNASITIDAQETEALLIFVPDPGGEGWDTAAIFKLAADNKLSLKIDPKIIEVFLYKASKAKEPVELSICQGQPPEEPVCESVKWEALPVPGDMAPIQEQTLAGAPSPRIFRINVEKIKHEKIIKKPGALPFLPGKEETVVTWEKKETREEVVVNGEPKEIKYADKGTKLGVVNPSTPGKPGKNIFGRIIPPRSTGDTGFLLGESISREKNELTALVSGFLRIGENWADIVPLSVHRYRIAVGIDGRTLFFHFEPGSNIIDPPHGEEILKAAIEKGAAEDSLISAEELDHAIAEAVKHKEPIQAYSLFRVRESEIRIEVNEDKTRASLFLRKSTVGGLPLDAKAISQAIKDSGVCGFDTEKLKTDLHAFLEGKEEELKDYVLAEGAVPTRGKDRELEIAVQLLQADDHKRILAQLMEWHGKNPLTDEGIAFDKATGFSFVEKGVIAAKTSAASEGEPGKDVYGKITPGLPGNDPAIKLFHGLELHGSEIITSQSGLLMVELGDKSFKGDVINYRDAQIAVTVSPDDMEARGDFISEEGAGIPLTMENVLKALAAKGIHKGIDNNAVEKACALARAGGNVSGLVVARGQPAIAPGGSAVKWLLDINMMAPLEPGKVDNTDDTEASHGKAVQIKAGTPIADLSEPIAAGHSGFGVSGKEIPVGGISVSAIEHDGSIREVQRGKGRRLIAARSGEILFDGRMLAISSVKKISGDAGKEAGKINFSGEIDIEGNVLPGCVLIAGSHVIIDGWAEEALISAGGRAVAALGIKGGGKGVIRARAGIEAAFAERASLMAVGDVRLKKGSIRSTIRTNGRLVVADDNGKLSGGLCQARQGVDVVDIGSEKGVRTEISFGQDYLIKDQINVCDEEIVMLRRKLAEIEEKIKAILRNKQPLPENLPKEKVKLVKLLEQLNLKVFTLNEKFEEHHESEVTIRGTVFPGVVMESHNRYYEVKQKRSQVTFYFDRETGTIVEKALL